MSLSKIVWITLLVLVLYAGFSYARIVRIVKHSTNPDIKQQDHLFQGAAESGSVLKYIAAGDSEVLGEGASSAQTTYPYKVAETLAAKLPGVYQLNYKNVGVSGAKTQNLIDGQLQQIIDYDPDIVTVTIGANDQTHLTANAIIFNNYKKIADTLSAKTHAHIYMTNMPNFNGATLLPWLYVKALEAKTRSLNAGIDSLNSERVTIINIHDLALSEFKPNNLRQAFSSDQFHLNDKGYASWAKIISEAIITGQAK